MNTTANQARAIFLDAIEQQDLAERAKFIALACGGDADTNASIAGQVAGALIGRSRLPEEMIARSQDWRLVEAVASSFAESLNFYE